MVGSFFYVKILGSLSDIIDVNVKYRGGTICKLKDSR